MKISLFNKDKGLKPPTGAFDFRPNRTVDSNPKLNNMKGDYVSPKNRRKRKYYTGGYFDKYASKYKLLTVDPNISEIKIAKDNSFPSFGISISRVPFVENNESIELPKYSVVWEGTEENTNHNFTLPELLANEGFQFKVSSGYRLNARTAQGQQSWHSTGNESNPGAYDIVPLSTDYDKFEKMIYSNPRVLAWLDLKGWGTLKENAFVNGLRGFLRTDGSFANTGASGDHFHFGPDKRALEWKEVNRKRYAKKYKMLLGGLFKVNKPYYDNNELTVNVALPETLINGNKYIFMNKLSEESKNKYIRPIFNLFTGSGDNKPDSYKNATIPYGKGPGHSRDNIVLLRSGKKGEYDRLGMYGAEKGKDGIYRFRNPNYKPGKDVELQQLKDELGFGNNTDYEFLKWCAENANALNRGMQLPTTGNAWTRHGIFGDSIILLAPIKKSDYSGLAKKQRYLSDQGSYVMEHIDEHDLQTGDIVDLRYRGSDYTDTAWDEGDSERANTHTGTILRTGKPREYTYVVHSIGNGLNITPIGELIGNGLFKRSYITGVRRPFKKK